MDINKIIANYNKDGARLMDILIDIQDNAGFVSRDDVVKVAGALGISRVEVEQTLSFYHFFSSKPCGKYTVYLNNSAVAEMAGRDAVAKAFEKAAGCRFGEVTADGLIGLYDTADIGMNDQEPAALINGRVFTRLTPAAVAGLVAGFKAGKKVDELVSETGDGANGHPLMRTMVRNNILKTGVVVFDEFDAGSALRKALSMTPDEVIWEIKRANVRGRGGAGFPVGMKWEFCRKAAGAAHHVLCNADEGEPGTFKDRAILTERSRLVFEGMVIAGYAIGASQGIVYLRGEYRYMKNYLESILESMRGENLLGKRILGMDGFDFDIRIQLGAGAYICGEESGLIESAEGKRGEPRNRPPFPAEKGYRDQPTIVNNVETFCCAARIILNGHEWFRSMGTDQSPGTKVLSVSGDCARPGVYEIVWGATVKEILDMCGASDVQAVQVGGPSGACIAPKDFVRKICYGDLPTGGSIIVIGRARNLLDIVSNFQDFFTDESCGVCVPCRAGTKILRKMLEKIMSGHGVAADLDEMQKLGDAMKCMNRCGLGQTAANPVVTTIQNFRDVYDALIHRDRQFDSQFDMAAAVKESCAYAGREAVAG